MKRKGLHNKPLVEAIFEIWWELKPVAPGMLIDPHYQLLVGRVYDKLVNLYPFHEPLPSSTMPDEIAGYTVQHRFREKENDWPLVQIGPGIMTLNDTEKYVWEDFEAQIPPVIDALFTNYPAEDLRINRVLLRYLDAVDFSYTESNILTFLSDMMKTDIKMPPSLFYNTGVLENPVALDLHFGFLSAKPKGAISLRFAEGNIKGEDAFIWETTVQSIEEDAPKTGADILHWANDAHKLADDWFFKLIENSELLRRFE